MTYDKWKTDPDDIKDRFERGEDEREELYADLERLRSINADLLAAAKEAWSAYNFGISSPYKMKNAFAHLQAAIAKTEREP